MKKFNLKDEIHNSKDHYKWILVGFGIFYLIVSFFLFYFLLVKGGSLQPVYKMDVEVIGIYVGCLLSALIWLYVFIVQRYRGFKETVHFIFGKMYLTTVVLATICSVIVPLLSYIFFCQEFYYSIGSFLVVFVLNAFILILCSPLLNLFVFLFVVLFGNILSYFIYHIYYAIKASSIKQAKFWENIQAYIQKNDKKIRKFVLYPGKVEFYLRKKGADKTILFRGYKKFIPIKQDAILHFLKQSLSKEYQVTNREYRGKYCSVTLEYQKQNVLNEEKENKPLKKQTSSRKIQERSSKKVK